VRLIYAFDEILPSTATDTEQVINTVAALGRAGVEVELRLPMVPGRATPSWASLTDYYQLAGPFRVTPLPSTFGSVRALQKAAHAVRSAARTGDRDAIWYTRNLPAVAAGLAAGYRVAFEHWRPWPDQYPPLQAPLRLLMHHPQFLGAVLHSEHARSSYERLGIAPERLVAVHNGYDPERMRPRLTREQARAQLGLPLRAKIGVYTGRVHENKGVGSLLELARRCPEMTLVIVGSERIGSVEKRAQQLANVVIVPWQPFDRTISYLYAADVLLLPLTLAALERHHTAVLPMKLFIYLASGRPTLAPYAGDTRELLSEENAALVPPDDVAAAARKLRLLFSDKELWTRTARAARLTSRAFTWDRRAERLKAFLAERLAAHPGHAHPDTWTLAGWAATSASWAKQSVRERLGMRR
jgi:starch synthase